MRSTGRFAYLVVLSLLPATWTVSAQKQDASTSAAPPFEKYSFLQYAATAATAPQSILRLDNNGAIVLAAREGIAKEALRKVVAFNDSQIALLRTYRLLDEANDTLRTAFPILDEGETGRLRRHVHAAVPGVADLLAPTVRQFVQELHAIGREGNAYTILFSYVLDGLVWDEFEADSLVTPQEITAETSLWAGEVWALYPPRAFSSGTNSISDEGVSLKVNWTEAAIPHMRPFVADFNTLIQMFDDYKSYGVVRHEHVREVFGPFNLFNEKGRFTIPVLVEVDSNPLYHSAKTIAADIVARVPTLLDLKALMDEFEFRDEKQALVIAYHEMMWDIMDRFEAEGIVRKPVAFADPGRARPADIADLVFIVRVSDQGH